MLYDDDDQPVDQAECVVCDNMFDITELSPYRVTVINNQTYYTLICNECAYEKSRRSYQS